ncbi:hypothetical protein ACNCN8_005155 [Escherichia coli]|uniref:hypothetical protein n=1 Tax=Escherichia coli TaxID=562 RepID=UPI000250DF1A|nr:hypothetical protein [Escherichia coli]EHU99030.1 phage O protein [Escherichia coli DEC4C]EHK0974217.1 hypothetical protein [Escherichia coli]EHK5489707.1 hypothetical protein [Escherichia coli]EHW4529397.1 hypothetical protein [Escherichia coli]EHW5598517.1 hypothetical protein [Escherichia coli]
MRPSDLLLDFGHPVAYYPGLVKYMGSPHAVIFFGQIFYWQDKAHAAEGVHKTREEIQHETGLTFEQQAVARKHLVSRGILVETNKRLEHKMFYRIDCERLNELINENNQFSRNGETRFRETVKPNFAEEGKPSQRTRETPRRGEGKTNFDLTENTTEITTENKTSSRPDASQPDTQTAEQEFLTRHPDAVVFSPKKRQWGTQDDLTCAQWLWKKIIALYEQAAECDGEVVRPKEPNWTAWANEIRLMCVQDGRTHKQICEMYSRVSRDPFWCRNVLSPSKLREKWDELSLRLSPSVSTHIEKREDPYFKASYDNVDYSQIPAGFRG